VTTVAVLGTGIMGSAFARNIARAGMTVRAWNRTREKAEPLAADGIQIADSPADAAAGVDIVLTMLGDGAAVEKVMGEGGALAALGKEGLWLQTSTVGIAATERLAAMAAEAGVAFVDSPVVGTRGPAEEGQVQVLASGPPELRDRAAPVFDAIGRETQWVGEEPGAASRMKLVYNGWLVSLVESLAETLVFARAIGVPPEKFLDAIKDSPIGFAYAELKGRAMVAEDFDEVAFPLRWAAKDARLVVEAAESAGLELPLMRATSAQFNKSVESGHGDEDMAAAYWASKPG
jgi:3-hydroxyisobutyrate dehydrogenase